MNTRYTLIIALLAIAAASFAYTQRAAEPTDFSDGGPTATPGAFVELDAAKVQELEAQTADGTVKLMRVAGGWEVDGKGKATEMTGGTVERLAKPSVVRDLGDGLKPDDYGFATPSMTVTLRLSEGEPTVLQVGDKNPIDPYYYVRKAGETRIVLVDAADWDSLKDWVTSPPLEPTATPDGGEEGTGATGAEGTPGAELPGPGETGTPEAEVAPPEIVMTMPAVPTAATAGP